MPSGKRVSIDDISINPAAFQRSWANLSPITKDQTPPKLAKRGFKC
jgi:hypothetical protein